MAVQEAFPEAVCLDTVVSQNGEVMLEFTPQRRFFEEQLQLILKLCWDVADQLYC
jgi:hypothetical protein